MRIKDKIDELTLYLEQLEEITPTSLKEYKTDITKKAACERFVEKIVESSVDIAFLIIKQKKMKIPEDDTDAFNILHDNKILNKDLTDKLKKAKGMRNIIAHQYGKIDDEIIYNTINEELINDIQEFIKAIEKL